MTAVELGRVRTAPNRRAVGVWLLAVAAIIVAMVTLGGLTRLTGSGLSITEWDPIIGAIPPLNDAAWHDAFSKYQLIPQYRLEHQGMSLEAFKGIFWWEWAHRFLGRLLGIVFFVPFLVFAWTGAIARREWPRMLVLFALGGLQGLVGWWMVTSGLETRVSVSQYRLAIHLGVAIILLGAILWTSLQYLNTSRSDIAKSFRLPAVVFVGAVYLQMLLGALVAGLHAGLIYNTWPSMDGRVFPEAPFFTTPWWRNFFENPGLVQFDHRLGAYGVFAFAMILAFQIRRRRPSPQAVNAAGAVAIITMFQLVLGIVTLITQAPLLLAALHQVTAATLFCAAIWLAFTVR